ncbi:hypothetical protein MRB53_028422 [Persea americana]|uniref:Uncharacterized protein n=1 Tax=Persea americana TaxID=3435 RepID=A0ACC2KFV7_PERAE|nr:hypothetical protein MRB53_028422 [Persea americana]
MVTVRLISPFDSYKTPRSQIFTSLTQNLQTQTPPHLPPYLLSPSLLSHFSPSSSSRRTQQPPPPRSALIFLLCPTRRLLPAVPALPPPPCQLPRLMGVC